MFAIKAKIVDPRVNAFTFTAQKTMYGGKHMPKATLFSCLRARMKAGKVLSRVASLHPSKRSRRSKAYPGKRLV